MVNPLLLQALQIKDIKPVLGGVQKRNQANEALALARKSYEDSLRSGVVPPAQLETFQPRTGLGIRPGAAGIAALVGILANAIEPGAGTQGLQGFTQGLQSRMDQENQAAQLGVNQRNQQALMTQDYAQRTAQAETEARRFRVGAAQEDVRSAQEEIEDMRKQRDAALKSKETAMFREIDDYRMQFGQFQSAQKPGAIRSAFAQLESFAKQFPRFQPDVERLRPEAEARIQEAIELGKAAFRKEALNYAKSGILSVENEEMLRKSASAMYGIKPEELGLPSGVTLESEAKRLSNESKRLANKLKEIDLKYRKDEKDLKLQKERQAIKKGSLDIQKLQKQLENIQNGKDADGRPLTATSVFGALESARKAKADADTEVSRNLTFADQYEELAKNVEAGKSNYRLKDSDQKQTAAALRNLAQDYRIVAEAAKVEATRAANLIPAIEEQAKTATTIAGRSSGTTGTTSSGTKYTIN